MVDVEQLLVDLQQVKQALQQRGWAPSQLFSRSRSWQAPQDVTNMCLTGAAGVVSGEMDFIQWVTLNPTNTAKRYPWNDRGLALLTALAHAATEIMHTNTHLRPSPWLFDYTTGFSPEKRYEQALQCIGLIIRCNDDYINTQTRAVAWVNRAIQMVADSRPITVEVKRQTINVEPKKKVVHVQADGAKKAVKQEVTA